VRLQRSAADHDELRAACLQRAEQRLAAGI
jgi:hypothetical protein